MMDELTKQDIFNKHGLIFIGKKRYYKEDLSKRDYALEYSVPYKLTYKDLEIITSSWVELLLDLTKYLHQLDNSKDLLAFKSDWNKYNAFLDHKSDDAAKEIDTNLYLYCNYTALHSCWLIQDLLDYFNINKSEVTFLITRHPASEPLEIRDIIKNDIKLQFIEFLTNEYGFKIDKCQHIVKNIESLNKLLVRTSKTFDDFFLFDDALNYANIKSRFKKDFMNTNTARNADMVIKVNRYLDYLTKFYHDYGY